MALTLTERTLIHRAARRDPEAFSELYLTYHPSVSRHVYYLVGSKHEADDITSETFLRAWQAIDRYQDRGYSIEAWLLKIGYHLSCRFLKKNRVSAFDAEVEGHPDCRPSMDEAVELESQIEALYVAIRELPVVQRQVVVLRFIDNMDYDQIGAIVGKSNGALRVILHRALRSLNVSLSPVLFSELSPEPSRRAAKLAVLRGAPGLTEA